MLTQTSNFLASIKALVIWITLWCISFYLLLFSPVFLRFGNPILNYSIFMLLVLLIPFSLLWLSRNIYGFWRGLLIVIAIACFIPISFIALITFATTSIDNNGKDLSFEKIGELKNKNHYYRLYRTNGGATTSFGLALRKETPLFSGLIIVSPVKGFSPASKGTLEKLSAESARLVVQPNGFGKGEQIYNFSLD